MVIRENGTNEHYVIHLGDGTWMDAGEAEVVVLDSAAYKDLVENGDYRYVDFDELASVSVSSLINWVEEAEGMTLAQSAKEYK